MGHIRQVFAISAVGALVAAFAPAGLPASAATLNTPTLTTVVKDDTVAPRIPERVSATGSQHSNKTTQGKHQ